MKFRNKLGLYILVLLILADDVTAIYKGDDNMLQFVMFIVILGVAGAMLLYEPRHK